MQDPWFTELRDIYHHIIWECDDEDDEKSAAKKELGLTRIRVSVAKRWTNIREITDLLLRKEQAHLLTQFLSVLSSHFETVAFGPVPAHLDPSIANDDDDDASQGKQTSSRKSLSSLSSSSHSESSMTSSGGFQWWFLDLDGGVWAIVKAGPRLNNYCVGPV